MRDVELGKRVRSGEKVPILLKGVLHHAWYMPKEAFGWKHSLTHSPIVTNKIHRTYEDLLFNLADVDQNWSITEEVEDELSDPDH